MQTPVAIIIPAYNEARRIHKVLLAALESKLATEIIVVSDGSLDDTAAMARKVDAVKVIELTSNLGKGGAMAIGVNATEAKILAFVDADLIGLNGEHIDTIIRPILEAQCEMCVGVFRGGKVWSDSAQRIAPFLSGQRAMTRELWEAVPFVAELRLGVELALTTTAKRRRSKVLRVVLPGVSNTHKEQKLGLMKGIAARTRMYREITQAMVKTRRKPARPKKKRQPWL